jgi:putative ABC transport system permease protein
MLLAVRNITRDRIRFGLSVAGVSLAVMLILLLGAYRPGTCRQTSEYLDQAPGSVVLAQHGVSDFLASNSILPETNQVDQREASRRSM